MLTVILVSNFFSSNLSSSERSRGCSLLSTEEQEKEREREGKKKVARDVFAALSTQAGLVYDVADTDCWTQMAAPTVMFSRLSNVHIKQAGGEIE